MCRHCGSGTVSVVRGIRWVAAALVGAAAATGLTGCGAGSWCSPLEPGPSVTAEYAPTARRLEALPEVTKVTARYWQPDDSHCVSREYLKTAAWSADFTVKVRGGFTLEQVRAVRTALGSSRGTVVAAGGDGVAAWSLELANPSGATPTSGAEPLLVDEQGYRLVTAAAALPDVAVVQQTSSTTIRVRHPAAMPAAATWLRAHVPASSSSWVSLGTAKDWTASVGVTGGFGVSDELVATAARVMTDHPALTEVSVSDASVSAVAPTRRQAEQVVAAFEQTPSDTVGQEVRAWWPDGNGTKVSGVVGSAR